MTSIPVVWRLESWTRLAAILAFSLAQTNAAVIHVRPDGVDTATGASWAEAVGSAARGLALAVAGDEVWVAEGRYTNHLVMKPGVALYGGFGGNETARAQRDRLTHETILDGGGTGIVLLVESGGPDTVVDGFTIQHGAGCGVRLYNTGAVISQNRIRWNTSSASLAYGAGISVKNVGSAAAAQIRANVILENYGFDGGGVACIDASPQITGNVIAWNTAIQNGGGISCWRDASPLIAHNAIYGNTANWVSDGGAVPVGGGGVFATADDLDGRPHPTARSSPVIRNNVVAANGAAHGGGLALIDANGGIPHVLNNTVVANSGSGIFWASSALVPIAPRLINNVVAFNPWGLEQSPGTPTNAVLENNCVFGNQVHRLGGNYAGLPDQTGKAGNLSVDPRLASVRLGNLHLQPSSPCRDTGQALGMEWDAEDIDGEPRVQGAAVDIGADESSGATWAETARVVRVAPGGDDAADGASWARAKRTVPSALDAIRPTGGEVWVAAGTYRGPIWLPAFVHLYGGFAGTEERREDRAPGMQRTVLDGGGKPNVVLSGQGGYGVCTLDGFTVTGGGMYTAGTNMNKYGLGGKGGGILLSVSSPVITNNVITRNSLAYDNTTNQFPSYGAGIACELSYAVIAGNRIEENEILNDFDGSGGGIYCLKSMPFIVGNHIARNRAKFGAAVYAWGSSPVIVGNTVESNSMYVLMPVFMGAAEGAISIHLADDALVEGNRVVGNTAATGAGLYFNAYRAGQVVNNLFVRNRAYDPTAGGGMGGAMYLLVTTSATSPIRVANNTLVDNVASNLFQELGGGIAFTLAPPATQLVMANNLLQGNSSGLYQTLTTPMPTPQLARNNVFSRRANYLNVAPGAGDVSRATAFVDPASEDYHLSPGTWDIDAADPAQAPARDLDGTPRPLDGDGDGQGAPDLGAFERIHPTADTDADGLPDAWEIAMRLDPVRMDAGEDPDGDTAANAQEYGAGTDPLDPESVLGVRWERSAGTGVTLRWTGILGRVYTVERATRLGTAPDWEVHLGGLVGTGTELTATLPVGTEGTWFVRVRATIP